MIVILHDGTDAGKDTARKCEQDIRSAFKDSIEVATMSADSPTAWPSDPSWDDLLVVMYADSNFPDAGNRFVAEYLLRDKNHALILPVALDAAHRKPPKTAHTFKAFEIQSDSLGTSGRLVNRVGAMLGLLVQKRDGKIFISYRASDGSDIAKQLHGFLTSIGFNVWLGEACGLDGDAM